MPIKKKMFKLILEWMSTQLFISIKKNELCVTTLLNKPSMPPPKKMAIINTVYKEKNGDMCS